MNAIFKHKAWPAIGSFVFTIIFLIGLPVLGWGLDRISLFPKNPVRLAYIFVIIFQASTNAWLTYINTVKPVNEHYFGFARWHSYMFETIFLLAAYCDNRGILTWDQNNSIRWLGLVIYLLGVGVSISADMAWIKHHRQGLAYKVDNPVLLYEGPYKFIRFPSILYMIIACFGVALIFRSWVGLVLMIPLIGGAVNHIHNLEREYALQYKNVWPLKRNNSKRLIPFLF